MESMKWIRCDNLTPSCDGVYLTWDGRYPTITPLIFGKWQANEFVARNITHWMPLPNPPQD